MAYAGESNAKKVARAKFWLRVREELGERRFLRGRYVVLASVQGGDLACLTALGVSQRQITAVDLDASAIERCRQRWPNAWYRHENVANTIQRDRDQTVVFLDFCCGLESSVCNALWTISRTLPAGALLGVAVQNGREHDNKILSFIDAKASIDLNNKEIVEVFRNVDSLKASSGSARRFLAIQFLTARAAVHAWQYRGHAVTMAVVLLGRRQDLAPSKGYLSCVRLPASDENYRKGSWDFDNQIERVDASQLRSMALEHGHELLLLPKSTVTAWRAHRTRGTYERLVPDPLA